MSSVSFLHAMHDGETTVDWTPHRAAATVELWKADWAAATRRLRLLQCRFFWRWLVEKGKAQVNPFDGLVVVGTLNAGKPQLRISEAHRFTEAALAQFAAGRVFALAPLLALMMGMRASEITERVVRDVDDGGAVIWIDAGKTKNARRHLKAPKYLRPLLVSIIEGRGPMEPLWGMTRIRTFQSRQILHRLVWELCDVAKVPRVCTHSLRGLWATLAVESGAAAESVAAALGHSSFETTAKHYAQPAAVHAANTDRAVSVLFRDRSVSDSNTESATAIANGQHTVQWNLSPHYRALGLDTSPGKTEQQLADIYVYERDASRHSLQLMHDAGILDLDRWLSDWWYADWAYLSHYYRTGERLDTRELLRPGQGELLTALPIPEFTPQRYTSRWSF